MSRPAPGSGRQRSHVVEELTVLLERHRVVAGRQQLRAGIAHEQRGAEPVAPEPAGHADDGVVDALGQDVDHPRSPHLERDAGRLGEGPHRPVVVDVHVLQHVRRSVDDDPLEADTGLRVAVEHRRAVGGAGEELVERRGDRARDRIGGRSRLASPAQACTAAPISRQQLRTPPPAAPRCWRGGYETGPRWPPLADRRVGPSIATLRLAPARLAGAWGAAWTGCQNVI